MAEDALKQAEECLHSCERRMLPEDALLGIGFSLLDIAKSLRRIAAPKDPYIERKINRG